MEKNRKQTSIGIPSMALVFMVMCMSVIGLLSLRKADDYWDMVQRNGKAVQEYYKADSLGEEYLRQATANPESVPMVAEIPIRQDQVLRIELEPGADGGLQVAVWKTVNQEDYEIDDSMPVWDGR